MPRNQRKESLKIRMSEFQLSKSSEVRKIRTEKNNQTIGENEERMKEYSGK